MHKILLLLYTVFFITVVSCSNTVKSTETIKAVENTDSCKLDPNNIYEVYIPEKNPQEKLPLLVIIDAHGSGKFALKKFKQAANQYPVVLVASDFIKNGFENYVGAMQTLISDVQQKYPVGKTIFITGFSGGARMALGYALNHQPQGLILCGALAGADQINALHCPVISISGMDDFNFIETAQYLFQDNSIPGNLKIELTNASHDWPDNKMLTNAFGFLWLSTHAEDIPSPAKSQIKLYDQNQLARIDSLKESKDFIKAALVSRNMSSTSPFNSDKTFESSYNELKANSDYSNQMNQLRNTLNFEIKARQPYIDAFSTKDSLWWKNEINSINDKIEQEQDQFKIDMYKRIKGFWGILCYSLGNQAVKQKDLQSLNKIISIYRMLEPENSYRIYLSAFPYFWKGNNKATIAVLKKAREEGFTEMSQLKQDFPESIYSQM